MTFNSKIATEFTPVRLSSVKRYHGLANHCQLCFDHVFSFQFFEDLCEVSSLEKRVEVFTHLKH